MSTHTDIVITGFGVEVPGLQSIDDLLVLQSPVEEGTFDPARKLGRKGLLYKDQATKLALCAVQEALHHAGLPTQGLEQPRDTGVIVSSNLGNIDTVCRMVQTIHRGSTHDLSPMDGPNASSNVVASTIAIRFRCQAINLMLCNGATSGIDALYMASIAIKTGRARRMLVVGVEPRNEAVQQLMADANKHKMTARETWPGNGAACVILESTQEAQERGATIYGAISHYYSSPTGSAAENVLCTTLQAISAHPILWLVPDMAWQDNRRLVDQVISMQEGKRPYIADLNWGLGDLYGAHGVFQCAVACNWRLQTGGQVLATSGGTWGDGLASIVVGDPVVMSWKEGVNVGSGKKL